MAQEVDQRCQADAQITISQDARPSLKRITAAPRFKSALELEKKILETIPERSVLNVLY